MKIQKAGYMTFSTRPTVIGGALLLVLCSQLLVTWAQTSDPSSPGYSTSSDRDAQREKIWNSPEMLEARAHVELTLKRSAQVTEEQAAQYMAELQAKSPEEMKIWLIQFQQRRAEIQRQETESSSLRRAELRRNLPAQNVGQFRNPVAGRRGVSSGRPAASPPQAPTRVAQQPQKPFSGREYSAAAQPLVTSQDVARAEILRGLGPWFIY